LPILAEESAVYGRVHHFSTYNVGVWLDLVPKLLESSYFPILTKINGIQTPPWKGGFIHGIIFDVGFSTSNDCSRV
jgi:hypothetical protein